MTNLDLNLASARIVSVRELTRDTARVLREVNEAKEPAVVTRHGKFVAVITPLEGVPVEVRALQRLAEDLPDADDIDRSDPDASVAVEDLLNRRTAQ